MREKLFIAEIHIVHLGLGKSALLKGFQQVDVKSKKRQYLETLDNQ